MKTVIHYKAGVYLPITETWIYAQLRNLASYCPIVYAYKAENLNIYPTENIRLLNLKTGIVSFYNFFNKGWHKIFNFYPTFAVNLFKDRPDLVHAHFGPSGYDFLVLKKIFKIPLITTFYGSDLSSFPVRNPEWVVRYKKLFEEGEFFLVEGNHMKKSLIQLGCQENKIIVQHLGVNLDRIKFMPREIGGDKVIKVLISASFREKKGVSYALEAFGIVKQSHPELKLELTVIGDSRGTQEEEEEKEKIFNILEKYDLKDCVNIRGNQPYSIFLEELYRHHIFMHPSVHASDGDTEGGAPVSIIEASASGMPVLSTTHCDIPEVIIDGKSGYLLPERDVKKLAEKLEFLVLNLSLWKEMGKAGREHTEKNYDIKKQVQCLEKIYDGVLIGKAGIIKK